MTSPESHFAALYCDYIKAAVELTTGIPAALVKRTLEEGLATLEHPRPRLVVKCELVESSHSKMLTMQVLFDLMTNIPVPAGDGMMGEGTTTADATAWMNSIRAYLNDADAFRAFILTLDEGRRTGWRIMRAYLAAPETNDDSQERTRDYRLPLRLRVAVV